jgi:hypothetical protein
MLAISAQRRLSALARKVVLAHFNDRKGPVESGCSNSFLKISESFGVKFSKNPGFCEIAKQFRNQCEAYDYGLAPFCFDLFVVIDKNGVSHNCFITEAVETIPGISECFGGNDKLSRIAAHLKKVIQKRMSRFDFGDDHTGNVGFIGKKLVCIDFGI